MRVSGWRGLFPSWEGTQQFPSWERLGVGPFPRFHEGKGREISVNPVRKFGRGFKPLSHCIFSNSALSDGRRILSNGGEYLTNYRLTHPYTPPRRGILKVETFSWHCVASFYRESISNIEQGISNVEVGKKTS